MQRFLRKWYRRIGFPATLFLIFAAVTGIWLAATEFFEADEAAREHLRREVSSVTMQTPDAELLAIFVKARAAVASQAPGAPVDRVVWQLKGDAPTLEFFLGKPGGGEDRKVIVDARTG